MLKKVIIIVICAFKVDIAHAAPNQLISVTDTAAPTNDYADSFGSTFIGGSTEHTITVASVGSSNSLAMGTIANSNAVLSPFSITYDNCSSATLAVGSTCFIKVKFAPTTTGSYSESFNIPSDSTGGLSNITFALSGIGVDPPNIVARIGDSTVDGIGFGDVKVNSKASKTLSILNNGLAALTISKIGFADLQNNVFTVSEDFCSGKDVAISSSCNVTVNFIPITASSYDDVLEVTSNDVDQSTLSLKLTGAGILGEAEPGVVLRKPENQSIDQETNVLFEWFSLRDSDLGQDWKYTIEYCEDPEFEGCEANKSIYTSGTIEEVSSTQNTRISALLGFLFLGLLALGWGKIMNSSRRLVLACCGLTFVAMVGACSGELYLESSDISSSKQLVKLKAGTKYYWMVRAKASNGNEKVSSVWSFTTRAN